MGFFQDIANELLGNKSRPGRTVSVCCRALRWNIDDQKGQTSILKFSTRLGETPLFIHDDNSPVVSFGCASGATFHPEGLNPNLLFAALRVGENMRYAKWFLKKFSDGTLGFMLDYRVPTDGISPAFFKNLCEQLMQATAKLDAFLVEEGFVG